jgi:hypothetical protein
MRMNPNLEQSIAENAKEAVTALWVTILSLVTRHAPAKLTS